MSINLSGLRGKLFVICFDDESDILELISNYLKDIDLVPILCETAKAAEEALEKYGARTLIFLSDYNLKETNGLEFRRQMILNEEWKKIPFSIISGCLTKEMALSALELKVSSFSDKPFDQQKLMKVIENDSKDRLQFFKDEDELIVGFIRDAENLLEELESLLLSLENDLTNEESLNRVFAIFHTIKGMAGFVTPDYIHKFVHHAEDFLNGYKKKIQPVDESVISILLKSTDIIKNLLDRIKNFDNEILEVEKFLEIFVKNTSVEKNIPDSKNEEAKIKSSKISEKKEIKIPVSVLDEFMELSGDITVIRNMINKTVRTIEKEFPGNKNIVNLGVLLEELHKKNTLMQDKVVDMRKVSLKNIFKPLNRIVRDLSLELNKEINFETSGDELRVDFTVAEVLNNSLVHMIRNSCDHGIEGKEERLKKGKNQHGKLYLKGQELKDEVVISIEDDGKGLNPELIRKKIVEKKLVTQDQATQMTESQLHHMIFEPGFSTATVVTSVSGRGVGTDMVKKSVLAASGSIAINSKLDYGCKFDLKIPIPKSVQIIPSLMVNIKEDFYAIPQDHILRVLCIDQGKRTEYLRFLGDSLQLLVDEKLYPVLSLNQSLYSDSNDIQEVCKKENLYFVLVNANNKLFAILVDNVFDSEDTVVKKINSKYFPDDYFIGATFLGDGTVGLILNVNGLAESIRLNEISVIEKSDQKISVLENQKNILMFSLNNLGEFAIDLDEVYRLEKFKKNEIQYSGDQAGIIYREIVMPVYSLNQVLGFKHSEVWGEYDEFYSLVFLNENRFYSFCIHEIHDLVQSNLEINEDLKDILGTYGRAIISGKTVSVIAVKEILKIVTNKKSLAEKVESPNLQLRVVEENIFENTKAA